MKNGSPSTSQLAADELNIPEIPEEQACGKILALVCAARYYARQLQITDPSTILVSVLDTLDEYGNLAAEVFGAQRILTEMQAELDLNHRPVSEVHNLTPFTATHHAIRTLIFMAPSVQCGVLAVSAANNLTEYCNDRMKNDYEE